MAQLLFLESENPDKDISLLHQFAGRVGLGGPRDLRHDAVHQARCVHAVHRPGGQHGRVPACRRRERQAFLAAELARHDSPADGRVPGQASDIEIQAKEILYLRERLNEIWPSTPGRRSRTIAKDTDRDNFMSAEHAVDYGLIDKVSSEPQQRRPK